MNNPPYPSVAVLIDGSFFIKRYYYLFDKKKEATPEKIAEDLYTIVLNHSKKSNLFRIFYYDCIPIAKKVHNPVDKKIVDFGKTDIYIFRMAFIEELKKKRKVALRLGRIKDSGNWLIRPNISKKFISGDLSWNELKPDDVYYEMKQKEIDMKIGVDIASLAYKKLVNRIVLISGDADFVPASKLARREGIDFILDPMWNNIDRSLFEHIDGLNTTCPKPKNRVVK